MNERIHEKESHIGLWAMIFLIIIGVSIFIVDLQKQINEQRELTKQTIGLLGQVLQQVTGVK